MKPWALLLVALAACNGKEKQLALAIYSCDEGATQKALAAGADPKANVDGKPVIAGAEKCLANQCEVDLALLERGVDPNSKGPDGAPWLVTASAAGHAPCARGIIAKGGRLEDRDAKGQTALIAAAAAGQLGVVEILVDRGADRNAKTPAGLTAQEVAEKNGYPGVASTLKKQR